MRFRRRTVIRERQVTVTDEVTHDDPPWQAAPAVTWTARYDPGPQGVDELDPARPVPIEGPAPVFNRLVRHPPVGAQWRSRLGFTADLVTRAERQDTPPGPLLMHPDLTDDEAAALRERFREAARTGAVTVAGGVPYPALDEDTLAGEFEPLPLEPLP